MNHDLELIKDARGPLKVFDADGNYRINWYEGKVKCFDFYQDRARKEFRIFVYEDESYQVAYLYRREAIIGSW